MATIVKRQQGWQARMSSAVQMREFPTLASIANDTDARMLLLRLQRGPVSREDTARMRVLNPTACVAALRAQGHRIALVQGRTRAQDEWRLQP